MKQEVVVGLRAAGLLWAEEEVVAATSVVEDYLMVAVESHSVV
jgi:hypothetical protein